MQAPFWKSAEAARLRQEPFHPYTLGLLTSEPSVDRHQGMLTAIPGLVPQPLHRSARHSQPHRHRHRFLQGLCHDRMANGLRCREAAEAMSGFQSQCTFGASSISQKAALAPLKGDQAPLEEMRAQFNRGRQSIGRDTGCPLGQHP